MLLLKNMLMAKFETFFLIFYISQERNLSLICQPLKGFWSVNRGNFNQRTALHLLIVYLIDKEIQNVFWRVNDSEINFLTLD